MKNVLITLTILVTITLPAQSKKELQLALHTYMKSMVLNKSYDVSKQKLFDAVYVMMKMEYPTIKQSDFDKGLVIGFSEADTYRETLTTEIIGAGPYRVTFSMSRQIRQRDNNGNYSGWYDRNEISDEYLLKIHYEIYQALYGNIPIPQDLHDKINAYNATQKKHKNKILAGRDY